MTAKSLQFLASLAILAAATASAQDADPTLKPVGDGWIKLVNGKDLDGWKAETEFWSIKDGMIVGDYKGGANHHHLYYDRQKFRDFEMHVDLKVTGWNAGVNFAQTGTDPNKDTGLHIKASDGWWGDVWPVTAKARRPEEKVRKLNDWNHIYAKVQDGNVVVYLNGVKTAEFHDKRAASEGIVGIGLHHGKGTKVEVRDFEVRPLASK